MVEWRFFGTFLMASLFAGAAMATGPAMASPQASDTFDRAGAPVIGPELLNNAFDTIYGPIVDRVGDAIGPGFGGAGGGAYANAPFGLNSLAAGDDIGDGLSAGGGEHRIGVWVSSVYNNTENDLVTTAYDADVITFFGGADFQFNDRLLAGVAVGWEDQEIDTTFNRNGDITGNGYTVAPYAGFIINRYVTADVSGGYTVGESDMRRVNLGGSEVFGTMDWDRWFLAGNLNGYYRLDRLSLQGQVGYVYMREEQEAFTETDATANAARDIQLGQVRVGATVGYALGGVEPYVTGTFEWDATRTQITAGPTQAGPANDRTGFEVGGGFRFAFTDQVSGGFEGTTELGRENIDDMTFSGNLRIKF